MLVDRFLACHLPRLSPRSFLKTRITATGLTVLLGVAGGSWWIEAAIAPPVAQAYTTRVDVGIDRLPNESYETMVRRAEQIARAAAQRSFDRDILTSQVSVIVVGRNQGAEAPILTLDVSRVQWRSRPDSRRWATYYRTSAALLGLGDGFSTAPITVSTPIQPAPAPTPTSVPRPVPSAPNNSQTPLPPGATPGNPAGTPSPASPTSPTDSDDIELPPEDEEG